MIKKTHILFTQRSRALILSLVFLTTALFTGSCKKQITEPLPDTFILGTVKDADTGNPITVGVQVSVVSPVQKLQTTGSDGSFNIDLGNSDLTQIQLNLHCPAGGYDDVTNETETVTAHKNNTINLLMHKTNTSVPKLSVSTTSLNFDSTKQDLQFILADSGGALLSWEIGITPSKSWLSADIVGNNPDSQTVSGTTNAGNSVTIQAHVDRATLPSGAQSGSLSITTQNSGGSATIAVSAIGVSHAPTTGSIAITVKDSLTNAGLQAQVSSPNDSFPVTNTDANGNVVINNLTAGLYSIMASSTNYNPKTQSVTITAGQTATLNFLLSKQTGTISGTVVDSTTTAPLQGATVTATGSNDHNTYPAASATNSSGTFTIVNVPVSQTYTVTASLNGYNSKSVANVSTGMSSLQIQLTKQTGTISGTVVDSVNTSSPISDVLVTAKGNKDGVTYSASPTLTDAGGNFSIPNLPVSQSYTVLASITERDPKTISDVTVPKTGLLIGLAQLGSISGYVSAQYSGGPVGSATLTLSPSGMTAVSQSDGSYKFSGVVQGTYTMTVTSAGDSFLVKTSNPVTVQQSALEAVADTAKLEWNVPTNGLQAYYPLYGNANDASGNGYNGTVVGSGTGFGGANRFNIIKGAGFDYTNNGGIQVGTGFNITTDWTISCWIIVARPFSSWLDRASQSSSVLTLADSIPPPSTFATTTVGLIVSSDGSGPYWYAADQDVKGNTLSDIEPASPLPGVLQWYHLVYTRNPNQSHLYVNGVDVAPTHYWVNGTPTVPIKCFIGNDYLAYRGYPYTDAFYGKIDDIRIYNTALSPSEVEMLYKER